MTGWLSYLLGTRKVILEKGSTWDFSLATPWSLVWFALAAFVIAVGVFLLYWRESVPLTRRQRAFFVTLRMLVALVVLTMLAEPSIFVSTEREGRALLALMLDRSESMRTQDGYEDEALRVRAAKAARIVPADAPPGQALSETDQARLRELTRAAIAETALKAPDLRLLERLLEYYDVAVYTFDAQAERRAVRSALDAPAGAGAPQPAAGPQDLSIEPTGRSTDVSTAVHAAVKDARGLQRTLAGVVLVTDGRATAGSESPVQVAEYARQRGVPLYAVAVGDPAQPRDVKLSGMLVNKTVFVDDPTQVSFIIENAGYEGQRAHVELAEGDRLIASKDVVLEPAGRQQRETFTFRPRTVGTFVYTVRVLPLPGELIDANNTVDDQVTVIKGKIKVLLVEGPPRWEYRFLKNALMRDEGVLVSCFLSSAEFDFIQEGNLPIDRFPSKAEDLFPYNVVILGDIDSSMLSSAQIDLVKEFVERLGGGLVLVAGDHDFMPRSYRNTELAKVMPVTFEAGRYAAPGQPRTLNRAWRPVVTEEGKTHPVTLLADDPEESARLWPTLPGLFWHFQTARPKPGATVLLTHPTDQTPLLVSGFYGAGRVLFLGIDSTWRWRYGVEDKYFYRFWGQVIRYLNAGRQMNQGQRHQLSAYKSKFVVGEAIVIRARLLDRAFRPMNIKAAEATIALPGGGELKVALQPAGAGVYEGQTTAIRAGPHVVRLSDPRPELEGEQAAFTFLVQHPTVEFRDTRADHESLARLAETSLGRFYHVDELDKLVEGLRAGRRIRIDRAQFPLWDAPLFFIIFFLAICGEWVYRKRQRLL